MLVEPSARARAGVEFGPAPPEFDSADPITASSSRETDIGGQRYRLFHSQYDLTGPEPVFTTRRVVEVTGKAGLQGAAQFQDVFDPRFERLVVHYIRVLRGGVWRDACVPAAFQVMQREPNMERAIHDGRLTAHMIIPDVREGDVVDTSWSIRGANPVLRGMLGWFFILQWATPVEETRCTVRVARDRPLRIRSFGQSIEPQDTEIDGVRVLDWRAIDLPPLVPDRMGPEHWVDYSAVLVADEAEWSDIADVFREAYERPAEAPAELQAEINQIAEAEPRLEDRVVAALRLVQTNLRYHSIGVGEGGYRPRSAEDIWATRYGDCKDASRLLACVLNWLDIEADCALVHTVLGDALAERPPHVHAFNHCVVRVRIGQRTIWLDPTVPPQSGDIDHLTQARYGHALPLVEASGLEAMPDPASIVECRTVEDWTFGTQRGAPADLKIETVYRGARADSARHWIAYEGRDRVGTLLKEELERQMQSAITVREAMVVEDDDRLNILTFRERYEVSAPLEKGSGDKSDIDVFRSRDDVVAALPELAPGPRSAPLTLGRARGIETERIFRFPSPVAIQAWDVKVHGPAGLHLRNRFVWRSDTVGVHVIGLDIDQAEIPAADFDRYLDFSAKARANNGVNFAVPYHKGKIARRGGPINWIGLSIYLVFLLLIAMVWLGGR